MSQPPNGTNAPGQHIPQPGDKLDPPYWKHLPLAFLIASATFLLCCNVCGALLIGVGVAGPLLVGAAAGFTVYKYKQLEDEWNANWGYQGPDRATIANMWMLYMSIGLSILGMLIGLLELVAVAAMHAK